MLWPDDKKTEKVKILKGQFEGDKKTEGVMQNSGFVNRDNCCDKGRY